MLAVAARIPDPAAGTSSVIGWPTRLVLQKRWSAPKSGRRPFRSAPELTSRELPNFGQVKQAEKGLIWALVHEPEIGMTALKDLQDNDLDGLATRRVLEEARALADRSPRCCLLRFSSV